MTTKAILLILACTIVASPAGRAGSPSRAQTQTEANDDANQQLRTAEAEMATVLSSLTMKASGHPDALAKLNRAQAAWEAYRDAQIDSLWPSRTPLPSYGSVHPRCVAMERTKLTTQRIAELRLMLKVEDGEVCFGAWPE